MSGTALFARQPPGAITDWPAFYRDVTTGGAIPFRQVADCGPHSAVISDLCISMSDVMDRAFAALSDGGIVTVFADVIRIDRPAQLNLKGGGLTLAARRIELDSTLAVDVTAAATAGLFLVTGSWNKPLVVKLSDSAGTRDVDLTPGDASVGRGLTILNKLAGSPRDIPSLQASYGWDTPLRRALTMILQYGTACFDSYPDVAADMFLYVYRVTGGVDLATDLRAQSGALLAALTARRSSAQTVPYLSPDLYEQQAQAYADAALAYEAQYQVYASSADNAQARAEAANLMLAHYADTVVYNQALLDQANRNYNDAGIAVSTAGITLIRQKDAVDTARIAFKTEAEIWAERQKIKAAFEIIMAVAQVVGAVAVAAVGDEAAAPEAAKAATEGVKAAQTAAKAAGDGTLAKLADNLTKIKAVADIVDKLSEGIPKLVAAVQEAEDAAALASIDLPASSSFSVDADWDAFAIDFSSAMKPAIDADIDGAQDYLNAVLKHAIYAKAAFAAKMALVKAGQEVLRLTLQQKLDTAQRSRVQDYVARQKTDGAAAAALGDIFFSRMLSMRLWLFLAVEAYADAFRYWALRQSGVKPSMITPVAQLKDDLAAIQRDYDAAYNTFNPPPQELRNLRLRITADSPAYAGALHNLQTQRLTVVAIALTEPIFRGWGRVRLSTLRVWLEGVAADGSITVDFATAGFFQDRLHGTNLTFSAAPVKRSFSYQGPIQTDSSIQVDGSIARKERDFIFEPTPFTQWQISVPDGIDLREMTAIVLEFIGSAIRDARD
jgi:hypothetical protein